MTEKRMIRALSMHAALVSEFAPHAASLEEFAESIAQTVVNFVEKADGSASPLTSLEVAHLLRQHVAATERLTQAVTDLNASVRRLSGESQPAEKRGEVGNSPQAPDDGFVLEPVYGIGAEEPCGFIRRLP